MELEKLQADEDEICDYNATLIPAKRRRRTRTQNTMKAVFSTQAPDDDDPYDEEIKASPKPLSKRADMTTSPLRPIQQALKIRERFGSTTDKLESLVRKTQFAQKRPSQRERNTQLMDSVKRDTMAEGEDNQEDEDLRVMVKQAEFLSELAPSNDRHSVIVGLRAVIDKMRTSIERNGYVCCLAPISELYRSMSETVVLFKKRMWINSDQIEDAEVRSTLKELLMLGAQGLMETFLTTLMQMDRVLVERLTMPSAKYG